MFFELSVLSALSVVLLYIWLTWNYNHWKKLGIPYLEPSLFFGNIKDIFLLKQAKGLVYHQLYKKSDEPAIGIYKMRQPQLLIRDAALYKHLTVNEFSSFMDHDLYIEPSDFFLSSHVFCLRGEKWKAKRSKISPALTIGNLKMYFPQIVAACKDMLVYLDQHIDQPLDVKEVGGLYCTDLSMSCIYGLSSNSFQDPETKYWNAANIFVNQGIWSAAQFFICSYMPPIGHFFKIGLGVDKCVNFYKEIVREAVSYRKTNNVKRNDFLQYVLDNSGKDGSTAYSDLEITGLTLNLLVDSTESSAAAIGIIMDVVLRWPEETIKLIQEIDEKIPNLDDLTYEVVNSLTYLNAFISEALRIRTPVPVSERLCTKDCEVTFEGKTYRFKVGDSISYCTYSVHNDSKYFPQPEEFRPERFLSHGECLGYNPFGIGPRSCLGRFFAMIEIKVFIIGLLKKFTVSPGKEMTPTVQYDIYSRVVLYIKDSVWIRVNKRT